MTQPDTLTGLTRRVTHLEHRAEDTRDALRSIDKRLDRLETAMLHQQTVLDGLLETVANIASTQAEHTTLLRAILDRLPEPPAA